MTIWGIAGWWLGLLVYAVAWLHGGRAERFGAAILILHNLGAVLTFNWEIGDFHLPRMILDYARLLVFGWLCFNSNRWWPLVALAAMAMMAFMHAANLLNPDLYMATASALVGLGYLADLALLSGVAERMIAKEAPAGRAAWGLSATAAPPRARSGPAPRSGEPLLPA